MGLGWLGGSWLRLGDPLNCGGGGRGKGAGLRGGGRGGGWLNEAGLLGGGLGCGWPVSVLPRRLRRFERRLSSCENRLNSGPGLWAAVTVTSAATSTPLLSLILTSVSLPGVTRNQDRRSAIIITLRLVLCIEGCAARASPDPTDECDGRTAAVTVDTV